MLFVTGRNKLKINACVCFKLGFFSVLGVVLFNVKSVFDQVLERTNVCGVVSRKTCNPVRRRTGMELTNLSLNFWIQPVSGFPPVIYLPSLRLVQARLVKVAPVN